MFEKFFSKFKRVTSNQQYFPEIDGIRFLAIVLVAIFHIHAYYIVKAANIFPDAGHGWLYEFFNKGERGVELFFVLSGFILCLPFAQQYINNGKKIQLKNYYLRRVTRLEPPYFIAITGIFILELIMKVNAHHLTYVGLWQHFFASLIYMHDLIFFGQTPIVTDVSWSLEIEIQFYILAPLFFKILKLEKRPRRIILLCIIVGLVLITAPLPYMSPWGLTLYKFLKYFFVGIFLADLYVSNDATEFFNRKWIVGLFVALLVIVCIIPKEQELYGRLAFPFIVGLFYYVILKNEQVKKLFSYKFIPIIGGMCYSIYLLHYTLIAIFGRFTTQLKVTSYYLPNLLFQMAVLCAIILVISSVFYYYIERPFMDKKWMNMFLKKNKQV